MILTKVTLEEALSIIDKGYHQVAKAMREDKVEIHTGRHIRGEQCVILKTTWNAYEFFFFSDRIEMYFDRNYTKQLNIPDECYKQAIKLGYKIKKHE